MRQFTAARIYPLNIWPDLAADLAGSGHFHGSRTATHPRLATSNLEKPGHVWGDGFLWNNGFPWSKGSCGAGASRGAKASRGAMDSRGAGAPGRVIASCEQGRHHGDDQQARPAGVEDRDVNRLRHSSVRLSAVDCETSASIGRRADTSADDNPRCTGNRVVLPFRCSPRHLQVERARHRGSRRDTARDRSRSPGPRRMHDRSSMLSGSASDTPRTK